jgi:hypothetical protein
MTCLTLPRGRFHEQRRKSSFDGRCPHWSHQGQRRSSHSCSWQVDGCAIHQPPTGPDPARKQRWGGRRFRGLQLSSDNRVHNIRLETAADKRAIFNDTSVDSLGRITLRGITTIGRVQILARDKVKAGHDNAAGGIVWATLFGLGGYLLGQGMRRAAGPLGWIVLPIVLFGGLALWRYFKNNEERLVDDAKRALKSRNQSEANIHKTRR